MAVYMPFKLSTNSYAAWCFLVMLMRCIGEVLWSALRAPCRSRKCEVPEVVHVNTPFNRALVAGCPTIRSFRPLWWTRGPHAQTMAMAITAPPQSQYRREMLAMPSDGVQVALDWKEDADTMTATSPLVLCLHGMGGCRESQYMRVFTDCAMRRGYRAVVYNRRGHGGTSLLPEGQLEQQEPTGGACPKIFPRHSNMDDMEAVVQHLCTLYPAAPKFLIGFSCGANLAINYLAAAGASCPFVATASVSNGYDIWQGTSMLLEKDAISSGVGAQFLKGMLLAGRLEEARQLAAQAGVKIDFDAVMKSKSVQELETHLVVPAYGYRSLQEYYDDDSCHTRIKSVQSPLLCICARKDPLVLEALLEVPRSAARANQNILTVITKHGGHMGWIVDLKREPWYLLLYFEYIERVAALKGVARPHKLGSVGSGGTGGETLAADCHAGPRAACACVGAGAGCQAGPGERRCSSASHPAVQQGVELQLGGSCPEPRTATAQQREPTAGHSGHSRGDGQVESASSASGRPPHPQPPVSVQHAPPAGRGRSQDYGQVVEGGQAHVVLELHDLETRLLHADPT